MRADCGEGRSRMLAVALRLQLRLCLLFVRCCWVPSWLVRAGSLHHGLFCHCALSVFAALVDFEGLIALKLRFEIPGLEVMQEGADFGSLLAYLVFEIVSLYFLPGLLIFSKELLG